jgi:hypothetical protein
MPEKILLTSPKYASFKDGYWKEVPTNSELLITQKYMFGASSLCFGTYQGEPLWIFIESNSCIEP